MQQSRAKCETRRTSSDARRAGLSVTKPMIAALVLVMAHGSTVQAQSSVGYQSATWNPSANSWGTTRTTKGHLTLTKGNPGDVITTVFTNGGKVIKNKSGVTPKKTGKVGKSKKGVRTYVPGFINGKKVNDEHVTVVDSSGAVVRTRKLNFAAFARVIPDPTNGALPIGTWLFDNGYTQETNTFLTMPSFEAELDSLYYGIDGVEWESQGFDVTEAMYGTTYSVVDGVSAGLPGIVFGTTELVNTGSLWGVPDAYTGTVTLGGMHAMATPTPGTLALLGLGSLVASRRRR